MSIEITTINRYNKNTLNGDTYENTQSTIFKRTICMKWREVKITIPGWN